MTHNPGSSAPVLAGYQVEELIGFGGCGEVWRARDVLSGRLVALKVLRNDGPPAERDRLRREAAVLAGLTSPHIVRLVTVATAAQGLVLVLEFQGGGSLASLLATRPSLAAGEVVTITAPLAAALADVHAAGMVHGDISPANVLFAADGRPVLSDLGVARLAGRDGAEALTAAYADPAVLHGAPLTPSADVYALAAVCFEALAGQPPFPGDDIEAVRAAAALPRQRLYELAPLVPRRLADVVESALSADADQRPDAAAFGARLLEASPALPVRLAGATVPVAATPTSAVRRLPLPEVEVEATPSRSERLAAALARVRLSPRRLVAAAAVPVAVTAAVWGGVAWAHSSSTAPPLASWATPAVTATTASGPAAPVPRASAAAGQPVPVGATGLVEPAATGHGIGSAAGAVAAGGPADATPADATHADATPAAATPAAATPAAATPAAPALVDAKPVSATPAGAGAASPAATVTADQMAAVLAMLDDRRDGAFTAADGTLLDQVYAPASAPLSADRARLAAMAQAGEHAQGLSLSIRSVEVVDSSPSVVRLRVADELAAYAVVSGDGRVVQRYPARALTTWSIRLVHTQAGDAGWRIAAIAKG